MNERKRSIGLAALMALVLVSGCAPKEGAGPPKTDKGAKQEPDEDPPPHGGRLFAVPGHKYHGELLIDEKGKQATVYLLDSKVRNAVPTAAESMTLTIKDPTPVQISLKPQRQDSDPKDASSRFVGAGDRLGEAVDYEKVEINGVIGGKSYVFTLDKD